MASAEMQTILERHVVPHLEFRQLCALSKANRAWRDFMDGLPTSTWIKSAAADPSCPWATNTRSWNTCFCRSCSPQSVHLHPATSMQITLTQALPDQTWAVRALKRHFCDLQQRKEADLKMQRICDNVDAFVQVVALGVYWIALLAFVPGAVCITAVRVTRACKCVFRAVCGIFFIADAEGDVGQ